MDSPRRLTKCNHYLCFMSHILTYIPHVSWKRLVSIFVLCFIGIQCCCYLPTVFRRAWFTRWQRQAIILYTVSNSSIQLTSKRKWFLRFYIISRILLIFSHMICILCCGDLPLSFIAPKVVISLQHAVEIHISCHILLHNLHSTCLYTLVDVLIGYFN